MICVVSDMLEDQDSRSITLLQVVERCRQEVNAARKQTNQFMQPSSSPALHVSPPHVWIRAHAHVSGVTIFTLMRHCLKK